MLGAAVAAVTLVPAASASRAHRVQLALVARLGDGAQGTITQGSKLSAGLVAFSSGHLAEFLFVGSPTLDPNAVANVAQIAASRIDAAGLGS
jgi:hypothetical protein